MKLLMVATTALIMGFTGMSAQAASSQDTAFDARDNIPLNSFGNCVRTKWDAASDACAPEVKPAPVPTPVVAAPAPAPIPERIGREARTVYFDFDKSTLTPDAMTKLNTLAMHVKSTSAITGAGIAGYADQMGTSGYNLELSKKRAKAVYDYLKTRVSINTQLLDIRALGDGVPQTTCAKTMKRAERIACLAHDRRVEVVFDYKE